MLISQLLLLFASVALVVAETEPEEIPWHVLHMIRSSKSKEDLHGRLRISTNQSLPSLPRLPQPTVVRPHSFRSLPSLGGVGGLGGLPSSSSRRNNFAARRRPPQSSPLAPVGEHHEIINNPVQFQDSCQVYNICVPVPYTKRPGFFHFPSCLELPQCLGSCCDGSQSCHAQETRPVKVLVVEYKYGGMGPDGQAEFSTSNKWYADMERHLSCGCRRCKRATQGCPGSQVLQNCRCQCPDPGEATKCAAPRIWDAEQCRCGCGASRCPAGTYLHPDRCRCLRAPSSQRWLRGGRPRRLVQRRQRASSLPILRHRREP